MSVYYTNEMEIVKYSLNDPIQNLSISMYKYMGNIALKYP